MPIPLPIIYGCPWATTTELKNCDRGHMTCKNENIYYVAFYMRSVLNSKFKHFVVVQLLQCAQLLMTPWTAARQASLSFTILQSLLNLMSIKSVMSSNHLILCRPLLLLPSIFPRIRVFSNESILYIRWPKYWSLSFSISCSNEYSGLISFKNDWFDLFVVQEFEHFSFRQS